MNNSINKIGSNLNTNCYQSAKCERKIKQAQTCDSVSFSGKHKVENQTFIDKLKNFFKKGSAPTAQDIESAKTGFASYQYQAAMINTILRKSRTSEEAAKALKQVEEQFFGSDSKGAYFIAKGFDVLSEPLKEDTTVYRYIYSTDDYNVDWKIGDKIFEKGFLSTTSDDRDDSYPKFLVQNCLKNYNAYSSVPGQFYTMEITIPKGTKVVKGNEIMSEVLLKYGSNLEVTDFDEKTNTYKCNLLK